MNREQRRKASIEELAQDHRRNVQELIERKRMEGIKQACEVITAALAVGLHKELGFGKDRINKTILGARAQLLRLETGEDTLDNMITWCRDYGVDI